MIFSSFGNNPRAFISSRFCVTVIAAGMALCASGAVHAQTFMTQGELLATIPGSQMSGVSNQDNKTT